MTLPHSKRSPGEFLKELRRILAPEGEPVLTQARLAKKLGLTSDYVYKLEAGQKPILMRHVDDLALLRPQAGARAQEFDLVLAELRAAVIARAEAKRAPVEERHAASGDSDVETDTEGELHSATTVEAKLDKADGKLDAIAGKLDKADGKLDQVDRSINRLLWIVGGSAGGFMVCCTVLLGGLVIMKAQSGTLAVPWHFLTNTSESPQMGQKTQDEPMPKEPLPNQKLAPCDPTIGESTFNGACWFASGSIKPPCGRLYRSGDTCYIPVAADPKRPVGEPQLAWSWELH